MSQKLIIIEGPDAGKSFPLKEGQTLLIGRGQSSHTRLSDPRLSRVHCRLVTSTTGTVLFDENSTGGTYVGGRQITSRRLQAGDTIRVGDSKIRFIDEAADSETSLAKGLKNPPPPKNGSPPDAKDLLGKSVGPFRLERIMHSGASGLLFRAVDEKAQRPAVVKVMLPSITADDEHRSRFVHAVHTMVTVRHPNLVEVYGAGKHGPFCWCAMELVDGISVLKMIELIGGKGGRDWREVYRVAVHVTRALECAHHHRVIHGNVTPDNLLQGKHDKVVKLCDLALARALEGTPSRQVTAPGQPVGNVAYMSPERTVDTSDLDWRSDQYGLGATLFALLEGHPPFQGRTLADLVQEIRSAAPTFSAEVRGETPQELLNVIEKMLAKSASDRFTFPIDLIGRLDEIGKKYGADADVHFHR